MNILKSIVSLILPLVILIGCDDTKKAKNDDEVVIASFGGDNEVKQGHHVINYDNSTRKRLEINYIDGKKDGIAREYYKSGKLKQEISYVMGSKEGLSKMYHTDGKTTYKEAYYKNNHIYLRKYFYKDGKLKSEASYVDDKPSIDLKEYYKSGKLKTKYPKIVVKENDDTALYNRVTLEITLSEKRKNVKFYLGKDEKQKVDIIDTHKYNLTPIQMFDKRAVMQFKVPKEHHVMSKLPIYVQYTTYGGRKKIDKLIYNLYVTNY